MKTNLAGEKENRAELPSQGEREREGGERRADMREKMRRRRRRTARSGVGLQ